MKATRTMAIAVGAALLATGLFAAPSVEITSVQQQYPWTNTVDIVYTVAGVDSETNGYFVVFTPTTSTGEPILDVNGQKSVQVALKGSGPFTTQWYPQTNQQYTACKMTPSVFRGAAKDYMIVDLVNGGYYFEPMATQEASNQRYNAQEYKTNKLVLRRIPAGTYHIGEDGNTGNVGDAPNSGHDVVMSKDYYAGAFPLTDAQWDRIVNKSTASNDTVPHTGESWNVIRGSALAAAVPSTGVMANLNVIAGSKGFDLPTHSMLEVAARAGCKTIWPWGDTTTEDNYKDYGWFKDNSGGQKHAVGEKLPNAWGLYDMCGNTREWIRDVKSTEDMATLQPDGLVPVTTGTVANSWHNGGGYTLTAGHNYTRLSTRDQREKNYTGADCGFRVFWFEL